MPTMQEQIDAIVQRYKPILDDLKRRAQQVTDDFKKPSEVGAVIGVDFKVDWKDVDFIFDVPSVTMRTNTISLDIPEVFMERQTIIFHTPSVRMVDKVVGRYPEVHGLEIRWKDIIISVPEPFMQEQKIIFDLPSVAMRRQEWKLDIPEFRMERVVWKIGLPQFTVINVSVETDKVKKAGQRLKEEGEQIAARMKAEIDLLIKGVQGASVNAGVGSKMEIAARYDAAIASLNAAISDLTAKGVDPIKVPTEKGDVNLRKKLAELIAERDAAIQKMDAQIGAI